ncbi:MAG TPA: ATP-binding protein [Thermoflexia bacterium]|nr:ATP-binding protein [Thermoflexia bacterium]
MVTLDELGFIPFSATGVHLIFHLCSTLCERVAMVVTTNLAFSDDDQVGPFSVDKNNSSPRGTFRLCQRIGCAIKPGGDRPS